MKLMRRRTGPGGESSQAPLLGAVVIDVWVVSVCACWWLLLLLMCGVILFGLHHKSIFT